MATEKQATFIARLVAERGAIAEDYAAIDTGDLSVSEASRIIDELLALPVPARAASTSTTQPAVTRPDVAEGRYAVTIAGGDLLVRVDRPADGRWAGYTFVSRVVGGRDRGVRMSRDEETAALQAVAADPTAAMAAFGIKTGTCGQCGRLLTDPVSVAFGIGPDCAERLGISRVAGKPVSSVPLWHERAGITERGADAIAAAIIAQHGGHML